MTEKENPTVATGGATGGLDVPYDDNCTSDSPIPQDPPEIDRRLSKDHLAELRASGISDDTIQDSGVYTAWTSEDLPEPLRWIGDRDGALPALVVPLEEAGQGKTWQVKPQPGSVTLAGGRAPKYLCPSKESGYPTPALIERRTVDDDSRRVLLVEGTKQALAVLSVTDEGTAVYGLTGITSWMGGEAGPRSVGL